MVLPTSQSPPRHIQYIPSLKPLLILKRLIWGDPHGFISLWCHHVYHDISPSSLEMPSTNVNKPKFINIFLNDISKCFMAKSLHLFRRPRPMVPCHHDVTTVRPSGLGTRNASWSTRPQPVAGAEMTYGIMVYHKCKYGVSYNMVTQKWVVYMEKPSINGWFGGTPVSGTPCNYIYIYTYDINGICIYIYTYMGNAKSVIGLIQLWKANGCKQYKVVE